MLLLLLLFVVLVLVCLCVRACVSVCVCVCVFSFSDFCFVFVLPWFTFILPTSGVVCIILCKTTHRILKGNQSTSDVCWLAAVLKPPSYRFVGVTLCATNILLRRVSLDQQAVYYGLPSRRSMAPHIGLEALSSAQPTNILTCAWSPPVELLQKQL